MYRRGSLAVVCCAITLAGCSTPPERAGETASGEVSAALRVPTERTISFLQISGRWNIRAIPEVGDTTATTFVLSATSAPEGWTITFPHAKSIPTRVVLVAGDSFVIETGPYPSTRRAGVQASSHDVYHLRGDQLVGTSVERYVTTAPDSVVRRRLEGSHAP